METQSVNLPGTLLFEGVVKVHVNGQVNEGQPLSLLSVGLADIANSVSVPSSVPTHCQQDLRREHACR